MPSPKTFSDTIAHTLRARVYEPVASTRDRSVREMQLGPHHIRHRFEFKGGVDRRVALYAGLAAPNPLLLRMKAKETTVAQP